MDYKTIILEKKQRVATIKINRIENKNSINSLLLDEINSAINAIENDIEVRVIVLEGKDGFFCTGMDFNEISKIDINNRDDVEKFTRTYLDILKKITSSSKVIVSIVDGIANAGGIGLIAASDIVISTERSTFSLSEALFGLLPATVIPFLIRRIGFQKSFFLTLSTQQIDASYAKTINLVDEISDNPYDLIRRLMLRITRIKENTVETMKYYFQKMWVINQEMETLAVNQITDLICNRENINGIKNFVEHQKFPWD